MKKLLLLYILVISCSSKNSLEVNRVQNDRDIIVSKYFDSPDSLEIYLPYVFEIQNKSASKVLLSQIHVRNKIVKYPDEFKYFDEDGHDLKFTTDYRYKYIHPLSTKKLYIYVKVIEAKKNINPVYWNNITDNEMLKKRNILPPLKKSKTLKYFNKWEKIRSADTIAFGFGEEQHKMFFKDYIIKKDSIINYNVQDLVNQYNNYKHNNNSKF